MQLVAYDLATRATNPFSVMPVDWQLLGSADGETWTLLDARAAQLWNNDAEVRRFDVAEPADGQPRPFFQYFQILGSYTVLAEWRLFSTDAELPPPPPREARADFTYLGCYSWSTLRPLPDAHPTTATDVDLEQCMWGAIMRGSAHFAMEAAGDVPYASNCYIGDSTDAGNDLTGTLLGVGQWLVAPDQECVGSPWWWTYNGTEYRYNGGVKRMALYAWNFAPGVRQWPPVGVAKTDTSLVPKGEHIPSHAVRSRLGRSEWRG